MVVDQPVGAVPGLRHPLFTYDVRCWGSQGHGSTGLRFTGSWFRLHGVGVHGVVKPEPPRTCRFRCRCGFHGVRGLGFMVQG